MATKKKTLGKGLANIYGDDLLDVINELENKGLANHIAIDKIKVTMNSLFPLPVPPAIKP